MNFSWNLWVNLPAAYDLTLKKGLNYTIDHLFLINQIFGLASESSRHVRKKEGQDGEMMVLLDYEGTLDDNPFLVYKSKSTMSRYINQMEKDGFLKTEKGHGFTQWVRLTDKALEMFKKRK